MRFPKLLKSELLRYVVVLTTGTALAQIINVLFSVVLTRIYSDEEFGEYGLYFRIISLCAAFATLRYELALPMPKEEKVAFRLYQFAMRTTLITVGVSSVLAVFIGLLKNDSNLWWMLVTIPIGVFFLAFQNLGNYWSIRRKSFRQLSYQKVTFALVGGTVKVLLGKLSFGFVGLIMGLLAAFFTSSFWFFRDWLQAKQLHMVSSRSQGTLAVVKKYDEFPKVNSPHILMDLGRDLAVAILIIEIFSNGEFGEYDLSFRTLQLPFAVIGVSIGQVFFNHCSELLHQGKSIHKPLLNSIQKLAIIGIIPFGLLFFFGEEIFAFAFGSDWKQAGVFAEIITPWIYLRFISSPISSIPIVVGKQLAFFWIALVGAIFMILAIVIPGVWLKMNIFQTLWILCVSQSVYVLWVIYKIIGFTRN